MSRSCRTLREFSQSPGLPGLSTHSLASENGILRERHTRTTANNTSLWGKGLPCSEPDGRIAEELDSQCSTFEVAETLGQEAGEDGCSDQLSHIGVHGDCLGEAKQYINAVQFTVVICILEPTPSTYCNTCSWTKAWELCLWTDSLVSSPFSLFSLGTGPNQNRGVN